MTPEQIRSWLMQEPRPAQVRVTAGDGVRTLSISTAVTWKKWGDTIHALDPHLLEALDGQGNLIRAERPGEAHAEEPAAPAAPSVAPVVADTDENRRFVLVAQLIADAYKFGTTTAFDKLVAIADIHARRSESLERSLQSAERMLRQAEQRAIDAEADAQHAE